MRIQKPRPTNALTLVEVLVVVAVLAVLVALLLPALQREIVKQRRIGCASCLRQISISARLFATDHDNLFPLRQSNDLEASDVDARNALRYYLSLTNELSTPYILVCPVDRERHRAKSFTTLANSNLSYFVNLDADETRPEMVLAGDRNLSINGVPVNPGVIPLQSNAVLGFTQKIHNSAGNITLADGSVQMVTSAELQAQFRKAGVSTNRIAVP